MDKKESPSQIQKQSRRTKKTMESLHPDRSLEMQGSLEFLEGKDINEVGEDSEVQEDVPELSHPQKRRSSNKSSSSRSHRKKDIPKTVITAVLEELNDDIISEPTRLDTGDCSVVEPVPQAPASLPPDKVYVERKNGFATAPRVKMFRPINYIREDLVDVQNAESSGTPLELAILVQKWCHPLYTLCHGLLGGMALLHIILVYAAGDSYNQGTNFVYMYTHYARVYQSLFHILCILCSVSVLDRCDAKHMDVGHLVDLFRYHITTVLILAVYLITLVLTFVTIKWDDWLALSSYSASVKNNSVCIFHIQK
ncbi:uncharacterized protein LOC111873228 isoform X2 [Cryptotermes secundus]|uniref:uncharacterized protein LOC111873228 isoform X2 n=1 Tax=Cryptotermes secundus TaxID=105785 RepID=UPI001454BB78|nr:uncharacterized protein LOC111873228 isoform X2 [Cryptotermes secundus]